MDEVMQKDYIFSGIATIDQAIVLKYENE